MQESQVLSMHLQINSLPLYQIKKGQQQTQFIKQWNFCHLAKIDTHKSIIATGGSAIYGKEAMSHLKSIGTVIYLKLPYEEIEERLGDLNKRGVSIKEGQTLKSLYEERIILYEKYADITIECSNKKIGKIIEDIKNVMFKK